MPTRARETSQSLPIHDAFMDADMRALWLKMRPLPGQLRLYGGTALALYLNHRESVDFDFFTPAPDVRQATISALPWLSEATLSGGEGVVEAIWPGIHRTVTVTFLEVTTLVPPAVEPPRLAPNGIAVASPFDLVRAKLEAVCNRGAANDYTDIAAAFRAWPELAANALATIPGRTEHEIAVALANPPLDEFAAIDDSTMSAIRSHGAFRQHGQQRSHDRGRQT